MFMIAIYDVPTSDLTLEGSSTCACVYHLGRSHCSFIHEMMVSLPKQYRVMHWLVVSSVFNAQPPFDRFAVQKNVLRDDGAIGEDS